MDYEKQITDIETESAALVPPEEPTKKYELTDVTITHNGVVLHQIRALRGFSYIRGEDKLTFENDRLDSSSFRAYVKKGEIGGYIQSESNLSQEDFCWIFNDAKVYGGARVTHNAQILNDAEVYGDAQIYGNAIVQHQAKVYGNTRVYDYADIEDNANVYGNSRIYGSSVIKDNAKIGGSVRVYGNSQIIDDVCIDGDRVIRNEKINKETERHRYNARRKEDENKALTERYRR